MIERIDKLNFEDNSVIKEKIGDESIYYLDKIQKKKNGLISKVQERNFLITDQAIYNFKGNELKRKNKN